MKCCQEAAAKRSKGAVIIVCRDCLGKSPALDDIIPANYHLPRDLAEARRFHEPEWLREVNHRTNNKVAKEIIVVQQ
eukprot:1709898-Amphidinium_carterae.1